MNKSITRRVRTMSAAALGEVAGGLTAFRAATVPQQLLPTTTPGGGIPAFTGLGPVAPLAPIAAPLAPLAPIAPIAPIAPLALGPQVAATSAYAPLSADAAYVTHMQHGAVSNVALPTGTGGTTTLFAVANQVLAQEFGSDVVRVSDLNRDNKLTANEVFVHRSALAAGMGSQIVGAAIEELRGVAADAQARTAAMNPALNMMNEFQRMFGNNNQAAQQRATRAAAPASRQAAQTSRGNSDTDSDIVPRAAARPAASAVQHDAAPVVARANPVAPAAAAAAAQTVPWGSGATPVYMPPGGLLPKNFLAGNGLATTAAVAANVPSAAAVVPSAAAVVPSVFAASPSDRLLTESLQRDAANRVAGVGATSMAVYSPDGRQSMWTDQNYQRITNELVNTGRYGADYLGNLSPRELAQEQRNDFQRQDMLNQLNGLPGAMGEEGLRPDANRVGATMFSNGQSVSVVDPTYARMTNDLVDTGRYGREYLGNFSPQELSQLQQNDFARQDIVGRLNGNVGAMGDAAFLTPDANTVGATAFVNGQQVTVVDQQYADLTNGLIATGRYDRESLSQYGRQELLDIAKDEAVTDLRATVNEVPTLTEPRPGTYPEPTNYDVPAAAPEVRPTPSATDGVVFTASNATATDAIDYSGSEVLA